MKLAIVKNGDASAEVSIYFADEHGDLHPVDHTRVKGHGHIASYRAAKLIEDRFGLSAEYVKPDTNDFDEAVLILKGK